MTMMIDERVDVQRRRQFAGEAEKIDDDARNAIDEMLRGDETGEFYAGLLAGLTAATTLVQDGLGDFIPLSAAVVAEFCEKMKFSD